ncbi:MAG: hypothetical protein GY801_49970 [bacterium]|nr:hypothetical protein [bacterium]
MVKDTYCPNCGVITPRWKIPSVELQFSKNSMIAGGGMYFFIKSILMLWQTSGGGVISKLWGILTGSVFFGIFFGVITGVVKFFFRRTKQQRITQSLQRRSASSLQMSERAIERRLGEMRTRKKQIGETLQEIVQTTPATPSQKILETFKSSLTALQIQRDRYTVKLWEIKLIRWYNTLKPLTEEMGSLTYDICDARVKGMTETIANGTEVLQTWENIPDLTRAHQQCISRLRKALNTCEQVRQNLLSHKAAFAVQGLSPLDEQSQSTPTAIESLKELDAFSILPAIGEFTSGLNALDAEYFRLKGEEEVYQEFEKDA